MDHFVLTPHPGEQSKWQLAFPTLKGIPPEKVLNHIGSILDSTSFSDLDGVTTIEFALEEHWQWLNLIYVLEWLANEKRARTVAN